MGADLRGRGPHGRRSGGAGRESARGRDPGGLRRGLRRVRPGRGGGLQIFLLAYTPCVATLAAQRREIGLWWTVVGTVVQLTGAWALAVLVFNALRLVLYWRGR